MRALANLEITSIGEERAVFSLLLVFMLYLFEEGSSSSWCLGKAVGYFIVVLPEPFK